MGLACGAGWAYLSVRVTETSKIGNTKDKTRGSQIFPVLATDAEGDAMYFTMTSVPDRSDLFEIEYGSGVIRAKEDLRHLCSTPVTFEVYVRDDYNPRVGPKTIQIDFENMNNATTIDNTKNLIRIDEDAKIGSEVFEIAYTDATIYPPQNNMGGNRHPHFEMNAEPKQGLDIYTVEGKSVEVRRQLDYEYVPLREVELTIRAFDGFCFSGEYKVTVIIEKVNEPFELFPDFLETTLNEGYLTYAPTLTFRDPDVGETFTFTKKVAVSSAKLGVELGTGLIKSTEEIKADASKNIQMTITVDVEDTATPPHTQTFKVQITVLDINDNKPEFNPSTYDIAGIIDDCTEPGTSIGKVAATDDDSDRNGNNILVFSGNVPGDYFTILSDGTVLLTKKMDAGQVVTGAAFVTDMGLDPGPLQGLAAVVTVTAGTCPTTPTPPTTTTAIPPTTPPPPTTTTQFTVPKNAKAEELLKATDTSSNERAGHSDSVGWMTTAAVAFVALVIILTVVMCLLCKPSGAGARKPVPQNTTQSYPNGKAPQNMPPQQYGKGPGQANPPLAYQQQAALGATAAPYNPNRVTQDPLSPRQQPPNGAAPSPYHPQPNGASPSPYHPQPNGAAPKPPNPQQAKGPSPSPYSPRQPSPNGPGPNSSNPQQPESSNPQQQQGQPVPSNPRMIIPAVVNAPAPPTKGRVTMENDQPAKTHDKTDKNSPRKEDAKKADKAKAEKAKGKTNAKHDNADQAKKPEKGKVNFAEYPLKPKMKVGENFDLEIITPRNSPLPYVQ
ncbi:hypothetical protein V1264_009029 [Littorina saxatilis]|uniref:Cadherin domain-containing protein n=1 Tax=Littorina saxatilis TaxID=31220 RepID=A0AAN9AQT3_9CAEN